MSRPILSWNILFFHSNIKLLFIATSLTAWLEAPSWTFGQILIKTINNFVLEISYVEKKNIRIAAL